MYKSISSRSLLQVIQIYASQDLNSDIQEESWHDVVANLLEYGVALAGIPDWQADLAASSFQAANKAMNMINKDASRCIEILPTVSSAHATGYHKVGGMSQKYNAFREGFVWSDGKTFEMDDLPEFMELNKRLEMELYALASSVIRAVADYLDVPSNWFELHLGLSRNHSQWHIKRFSSTVQDGDLWLATHTDPSLVSVVLHDLPGITPGGSGFQFHYNGMWQTIPVSGHSVAIIMVGSVLQHVTRGLFKACRHRVLTTQPEARRMATTFFLRPAPDAVMKNPSSPKLTLTNPMTIPLITFEQWLQKTARNYEKSQRNHVDRRDRNNTNNKKAD